MNVYGLKDKLCELKAPFPTLPEENLFREEVYFY